MIQILFYIVVGILFLLGFGALKAASQVGFRSVGLVLGGLIYLGGAVASSLMESWWVLLISFGLVWVLRLLGFD